MADQLQLRRGTTAQMATFTGAQGEIVVDTDKDTVVVHDGATAGGFPLASEKSLVDGTFYFNDDTGSGSVANAYILSPKSNTNTPTVYKDGQQFGFVTANANTGPATANFSGLGVRSLKWPGGLDPVAGDISGRVYLIYNQSSNWFEIQDIKRSTDYLNTTRINVASTGVVDLTTSAPNTRNINITGTTTITGFTVVSGQLYFVRFNAALTLTNGAGLVTQSGANITTDAGDTCILRATAANTVEVLSYSPFLNKSVGYGQTWQDMTASRATGVNYTNTAGKPIFIAVRTQSSVASGTTSIIVDGLPMQVGYWPTAYAPIGTLYMVIPSGSVYSVSVSGMYLNNWWELR